MTLSTRVLIYVLLFFGTAVLSVAADVPRQITKSSSKEELNAQAEIKAFYLQLADSDPEIQKQIKMLTAKPREDYGGIYHAFEPQVVEWFPTEHDWDAGKGSSQTTGHFLVIQPAGYGRSKSTAYNTALIAEFEAVSENTWDPDRYENREPHVLSSKLTMTFLGFLNARSLSAVKDDGYSTGIIGVREESHGSAGGGDEHAGTSPEPVVTQAAHTLSTVFDNGPYADYNGYSRRQILRRAQRRLRQAGLYHSGIDGAMGPGTQAAIIAWQQRENIPVTGLLDEQTLQSMSLLGLAEQTPPRKPIVGEPVREDGPRPEEVLRRVLPWIPH